MNFRLVAALLAMLLAIGTSAAADGGKAKMIRYAGQAQTGTNDRDVCLFTVELQPVLFYLTSVNNKYQVVLMRAQNLSQTPLTLSRDKDKISLTFGSKTIPAEVDLAAKDPAVWDQLPLDIRQAVLYPPTVLAGEEEGIYIFIVKDALKDFAPGHRAPSGFIYTIDSLHKTIRLGQPAAKE